MKWPGKKSRAPIVRIVWVFAVAFIGWELSDVVAGVYKVVRTNAAVIAPDESRMIARPVGNMAQPVLRFIVFGDSGTGLPAQSRLAKTMEARCLLGGGYDAMLLLGDLVYPDGVTSLDDPLWADRFDRQYRSSKCLAKTPAYPVLGNHDYIGDPVVWLERGLVDPLWNFPARSWAVEFAKLVTVIGVDSTHPWLGGLDGLESESSDRPWRIAIGHHPLESSSDAGGRHRGGGIAGFPLKRALCGDVDVYLSGHAHHLEHRRMPDCRIDHFISGAAGAGLTGVSRQDEHVAFAAMDHGFVEITVARRVLVFRFINTAGKTIYQTRLVRRGRAGETPVTKIM